MPINKRNISTVYQNHLLFPHMNVKKNIEYGYNIKNRPERIKTLEILDILKIEHSFYSHVSNEEVYEKTNIVLNGGEDLNINWQEFIGRSL